MNVRWFAAPVRRRAAAGLLFVALGALLLAACGGGDSNGGTSTTAPPTKASATTPSAAATAASTSQADASTDIDACALVTKAEVEAATGVTVGEPKPSELANLFICSFEDPAPPNLSVVDVSVFAGIRDGDAQEIFDMAKENGNDPQKVDGFGDEAYWDDVLHTLNVVKGNNMLGIDVGPVGDADRLTVAKDLAGKALGRLP